MHTRASRAGSATPVASRPPVSLTSLVGREQELHDLTALVGARRLVTLTGPGGSGKTRLAAELALRIDWQRADSVVWVVLGASTDPERVPQQVAGALSLRTNGGNVIDAIADALRERDLLLVLDDCEHLVAACADLAETLLVRCPRLHIVATSREPLGVAGEHVWPVPPIAPDEAAQLFAERAAAVEPSFAVSDANRDVVAEICRRLDGMPLAIELAAARVRVLTPQQIAARLEDRFSILTGGARTTMARHRTLRAAIDWSFALLGDDEQSLLARLSVFPCSFSLEVAESVCGADLDRLTGLVDKSLVATTSRGGVIRYYLLETIRQYASERLAETNEGEELHRRHALAFLAIARDAVIDPMSSAVMGRLARLDAEHENVRAALAWSIEHEPDAIALPLAASFRWYWYYRILWSEGLDWTTRALSAASRGSSSYRASVLSGAGTFAAYVGDLANGRARLEEAEAMWRALGDTRELALTLSALAQLLANAGALDAALARANESVSLARANGTMWDVAYCLTNAAAFVAQKQGRLDDADHALEEAEAIWRPSRHPLGIPFVLNQRALLALRRGDRTAAAEFARAALRETREMREAWFTSRSIRILAHATDDPSRAATLLGAAGTLLRTIGARILVHETSEYERLLSSIEQRLGSADAAEAFAAGRAMSFDQACDLALAGDAAPNGSALLDVCDLGPLQITLDGKPLESDGRASQRARELLVFLLSRPHGTTKEEAGVAFWPDATTEQVKNSFHVTLHRLRKLLGGAESVVSDGSRYTVAIPHTAQSRRFESEMTAALQSRDAGALEAALALYRGDYLQGDDAGEWCLPIRAHLRGLHLRGLFALAQVHESRGRYTDAVETYTRVLARDPFHEAAARQLMICHARLGARSESLLVYRELEQRLKSDLEAEPEPETATLYQRLRRNELVVEP